MDLFAQGNEVRGRDGQTNEITRMLEKVTTKTIEVVDIQPSLTLSTPPFQ